MILDLLLFKISLNFYLYCIILSFGVIMLLNKKQVWDNFYSGFGEQSP